MTDILPPAGWPNVRQLETNEFATGGANGNMNEQAKSLAARSELLKQYAALPYKSKTGGYALNERVQLATGDIVRSTIAGNVNNPNVNMTGWKVPSLKTADNLSDVPDKAAARSNLSVYSQAQVDNAISNAVIGGGGGVVINNTLTSTSTTQALSAAQGKALQDNKLESNKVGAANGVASLDANSRVPVAQLPAASTTSSGAVQLNNTLTSTSTTQALSAAQGKALQDNKLESNKVGAANGVASLDANSRVPVAQLPAASTTSSGAVQLNNTLTSTSTTEALTANMGRELKSYSDQVLNDSRTRATTEIEGRVQIATEAEVLAGTNNTKAVTPEGVKRALSAAGTGAGTIPNATETVAGVAEIATSAEVNYASDDTRIVTAKKLFFGVRSYLNVTGSAPMFACRAWVNFNGIGTPTIRASGNVSSITDNGVGDYTINLYAPMPDSNYCVTSALAKNNDTADANNNTSSPGINNLTTTSFRVVTGVPGNSVNQGYSDDMMFVYLSVFR